MPKPIVVAIDGHSSTGKSTVAKQLANHFNFIYIDSGAMYRAVTLFALKNDCFQDKQVDRTKLISKLDGITIDFKFDNSTQKSKIILNGKNVENSIRGMEVSERVSHVAAIPEVRDKLVALQREIGKKHSIIMDGRDIGSVVFPNADVKFFMTASADERAKRRFEELKSKGDDTPFEAVLENVKTRDHIDSSRAHSPLIQTDDAILIDNTQLTQENQFKKMMTVLEKLISSR